MKISSETLQKLKYTELNILIEFDRVCKKLGINYTLAAGTLLGAVRHQGFIPWDDDIDVEMLREDYDKLIAEGQPLLPDHLFIQTYETDKKYPFSFAKIRDTSTVLLEDNTQSLQMKNGVFIDVFPIDRVSSNKIIRWMDHLLLTLISIIKCSCTIEWAKKSRSRFRRTIRMLLFPLARLISTYRLNRIETFIRVKNNKGRNKYTFGSNYHSLPPFRLKDTMLVPIDIYCNTENIVFENREFKAIKDRHTYLTVKYGNYMQLPPEEERTPHHAFVELKFNT